MIKIIFACIASITIHAVVFVTIAPPKAVAIAVSPSANNPNLAAAEHAFAALDHSRAQIAKAETDLIASFDELVLPEVKIAPTLAVPKARPAIIANRAEPKPKAASKPTTPAKKQADAPKGDATPASNAQASSAAQSKASYQAFGQEVHSAFLKALRTPLGVSQLRAKIQLRFENGRYNGAVITESSGNAQFDQALLAAAKRARFPNAPSDLTASARYNIPVKI